MVFMHGTFMENTGQDKLVKTGTTGTIIASYRQLQKEKLSNEMEDRLLSINSN